MIGAIIGDIAGSRFTGNNHRSKDFELLVHQCSFTGASVAALAICDALLRHKAGDRRLRDEAAQSLRDFGRSYPDCGYDSSFQDSLYSDSACSSKSSGDEAIAMACACGYVGNTIDEVRELSESVAGAVNNNSEILNGAAAAGTAVYLARTGKSLLDIQDYIVRNCFRHDFTPEGTRGKPQTDSADLCSVKAGLQAFFESDRFEDAIRNAISAGGSSSTAALIAGAVAEAYYGVPTNIRKHSLTFLDERLLKALICFENQYTPKIEKISEIGSVGVVPSVRRKVKTGGRAEMMKSAMDAADSELDACSAHPEQTTSQKLFSDLFEACNILRGPINQDEYKSYVTPILFFKRISDVYDEETEQALRESGGDKEYARLPELHSFVIPDGCHWKDVQETAVNVGNAIVNAITGIERANPDTLSGVFTSFDDATWTDKTKLSDERLRDLVNHMSGIKVGNSNYSADVMGDSYEFLIKKFADLSKKNAGEFYTPRSIVKLLVMLLAPKTGETVYDPACGTGGMLIEAIRYMHGDRLTYGKIYGQEKNLATSAIARMNLFLHGAKDFKVTQGDTLLSPNYLERGALQTFDCVLANPPFSIKKWGAAQFSSDPYGRNIWGCPTDSNGDFAWLQHMVSSMDPKTGRCAVVLPQGVLFRGGKEGEIRKKLVESDKLDAIITLVGGVFYSTGVSACILFLSNNKEESHRERICMIDASEIYTPQRAQNIMTESDIQKVFNYYKAYEDVIDRVKVVSLDDIRSKQYSLAINNYIEKKQEETVPPEEVRRQYFEAYNEIIKAEARMRELLLKGGYVHE